jgi:4-hydroxy-tetrahydrodipicolinate reductase
MAERIKVLMNGAMGRMGKVISAGLAADNRIELIAAVDTKTVDTDYGYVCGINPLGFGVETNLKKAIKMHKPDVVVDFTSPKAVLKNVFMAVSLNTPIVVGTTGLKAEDYTQIEEWCKEYNTAVFVAPNFALGAVLLMKFAAEAAKYMPHVEVIERHHDKKVDAPSGTAVRTLEMISANRPAMAQGNPQEFESIDGSRGGEYEGMRVHSVRLPGYMATQEVVFGDLGQVLCLRHDALTRECYIPGVLLAVTSIMQQEGLVVGLENLV